MESNSLINGEPIASVKTYDLDMGPYQFLQEFYGSVGSSSTAPLSLYLITSPTG